MNKHQRLQSDLLLLITALVWGSAFVAQRIAAQNAGTFLFNGLRFWVGAGVLGIFASLGRRSGFLIQKSTPTTPAAPARGFSILTRAEVYWPILTGGILYVASSLQQAGLKYTSAANAGFITGLYVVFLPLILVLFMRQRLNGKTWFAALLATLGVFLLSGSGRLRLAPGDALELVGAIFWALHLLTVGLAVKRLEVLPFSIAQFFWAGMFNLVTGLFIETSFWPALAQSWWTIAYTGIFSVGIGYTLQAAGQRHAPPVDAALILSLEAVFAAFFGYLFIREVLAPLQLLGCALIFGAVLFSQLIS